jgi:hypothetical protein
MSVAYPPLNDAAFGREEPGFAGGRCAGAEPAGNRCVVVAP